MLYVVKAFAKDETVLRETFTCTRLGKGYKEEFVLLRVPGDPKFLLGLAQGDVTKGRLYEKLNITICL